MKKIIVTTFLVACFVLTGYSQDTLKTSQRKQKPKATYQVGGAKITVWENEGKNGTWKNFSVEKVYKKNGKWLTSNSFNSKELLELKEVIDKAITEENVKTTK